jgi:hypothetical protein
MPRGKNTPRQVLELWGFRTVSIERYAYSDSPNDGEYFGFAVDFAFRINARIGIDAIQHSPWASIFRMRLIRRQ